MKSHEELTHDIIAQNFVPETIDKMLPIVKEYLKENEYTEDEEFWFNKETELEMVLQDLADAIWIPVYFHLIQDGERYMIWKGIYKCWDRTMVMILDEDYDFECTWASQLVDKLSEVQAEYINGADRLATFVENILAN